MEKGARDGKTGGAFGFALSFLWLLLNKAEGLFQDKESDKPKTNKRYYNFIHHPYFNNHHSSVIGENTNTNRDVKNSFLPLKNKTIRMKCLLIFLLLLQTTAFAQRKLKYDIIKESSDTVFYTSEERLYISAGDTYGTGRDKRSTVGDYLKSTVLKYASGFVLEFSIQTGRTNSFSIYAGQSAKLIMSDGSVISLPSRADYSAKKSSMGYGCWLFAFYTLSVEAMEKIKTGTIADIRIESSMGSFDYPLKEKAGMIIAEQLKKF